MRGRVRGPIGIGIDVGSTNTKVVAASPHGPLAVFTRPTAADPNALLAEVFALVREAVAASPATPVAVGIASMAETGWALGDDGPLTPLLRWDARRPGAGPDAVAAHLGADALFAATGVRPGPKPTLAALLDLRTRRPEVFARLRRWAGVADGVHLALTGRLRTDHTLAGRTLLYRLPGAGEPLARGFDTDLASLVGLAPDAFGVVGLPGDPLDRVAGAAASATGLPAGTPVLVAGHDHQVAAWASGVRGVGDVADSVGTAEALLTLVAGVPDRVALRHEGMSLVRVVDGVTEAVLAGSPSSGAFLQWLADRVCGGDVDALLASAKGAADRNLPSPGFWLPYPAGRQSPHPDAAAPARHVGPAGDQGIEALEALSLQAAWLLSRQRELTASREGVLTVIGEPVRRVELWGRLKATLAGASLRLVTTEQPVASGAALLALVRAGVAPPDATLTTASVAPMPLVEAYARRLDAFVAEALGAEPATGPGPEPRRGSGLRTGCRTNP